MALRMSAEKAERLSSCAIVFLSEPCGSSSVLSAAKAFTTEDTKVHEGVLRVPS